LVPAAGQGVSSPAPLAGIGIKGALSNKGPTEEGVVSLPRTRESAGKGVVTDAGSSVGAGVRVEIGVTLPELADVRVVTLDLLKNPSVPRIVGAGANHLGAREPCAGEKCGSGESNCQETIAKFAIHRSPPFLTQINA